MQAKFGLVLVVAVLGALMFLAGASAPDSLRLPAAALAKQLAAKVPLPGNLPAKSTESPEKKDAAEAPPVTTESLLLPTPLPVKAQYALQIGQFGLSEAADRLMQRAQENSVSAQRIAVVDRNGQKWWIVAVGSYGTPDEARTARPTVARATGVADELPVIVLPPAKS